MQNIFFAIFKMKTITLIFKAVTYQDVEQQPLITRCSHLELFTKKYKTPRLNQ